MNIVGTESREAAALLYASGNYITLLPGESRTATLSYACSELSEAPDLS